MTAAIYAGRQKMNTLLVTKDFGGQMAKKATEVENYPGFIKISNFGLIKKMEDQVKTQPDVKIIMGEVIKVENESGKFAVSMQNNERYESIAAIVATGADPRPLEVPGEKEFVNKGVSYCALCDGPVFRDKEVAVIGGGNSGFETAIFLSNYVKKIYLLESKEKVSADSSNQLILKNTKKAEILLNAKVKEIKGDKFVSLLVYEDEEKKQKELKVEGVFVEIGYQPATAFVKNLVDFNKRDEIETDSETYQTKTPGLYAAGDCNKGKFKQVITAAGEGAKAALAAYGYIEDLKYKK